MNKKERSNVLRKLKPQTWYTFCMLEATHDAEVTISRIKLAAELDISEATLAKCITTWKDYGLIRMIPGGFIIAQLDGVESGIKPDVIPRKYNKAKDIVDEWSKVYYQHYGEPYLISNWGMTLKNVKKLLIHSDEDIEGTIYSAITLYQGKWVNPKYPRPTLGQFCSWLFAQALPYAERQVKQDHSDENENLLDDLVGKGWI